MAEHIPEDVIAKIFQWLPIKSFIRFTSISKRWRFIILHDPHFATSQYQIASHNNKSVCFRSRLDSAFFESVNLQTRPSALRNLRCPFKQPDSVVFLYSSCRGLVFATFNGQGIARYIWNPSTGLFKKLPDPGVKNEFQVFNGFGYIWATDDYKILIANSKIEEGEEATIHIFSSKSNSWKRIQDSQYSASPTTIMGTPLNEALHWLEMFDDVIVAFDLADEEFRTMPLPVVEDHYDGDYFRHLGVLGGCLCVFGQADTNAGSMDMWVMREYNAGNSWTKLFKLKFSNQPEQIYDVKPIWVMETGTFLEIHSHSERRVKLVRSYYNEQKMEEIHMDRQSMIGYEESLLWLELDIEESSVDSVYVTAWASPYLPLHMGKTENASEMVETHFGRQLQAPIGENRVKELGQWVKQEFHISGNSWDSSSVDIAAAGLGWFAVGLKGEAVLSVWTYDGIDFVLRNSLLPNRSYNFEVSGFTVSKIVSKADKASNKSQRQGEKKKKQNDHQKDSVTC